MALNLDKMRKAREEKKLGADFWQVPVGETAAYLCPPCKPEDELNFYEVRLHYGMKGGGKDDKSMAVCLDTNKNTILNNPFLLEHLAALEKDISGGCPKCEELDSGAVKDEAAAKRMRSQSRFLWNLMPMKFRASTSGPWSPVQPANQVVPLLCGWQVWDGIMEQVGSEGDVTNYDSAILIRIQREGTGQNDTKYKVQCDTETLRKPLSLSVEARAAISAAMADGGTGDMYRVIAGMIKTREQMLRLQTGVATETETAETAEEAPTAPAAPKRILHALPGGKTATKPAAAKPAPAAKPSTKAAKPKVKEADPNHGFSDEVVAERGPVPPCYTLDCASDDQECQACPYKVECAGAMGVEVPPDIEVPEEAPLEAPEAHEADDAIAAQDAEVGHWYLLQDGTVRLAQGVSKHAAWFQSEDGERVKLALDEAVTLHEEVSGEAEAPAEEPAEEAAAEEEAPAEEPAAEAPEPPQAKKVSTKPAVAAKPAATKPVAVASDDKLAKLDQALKAKAQAKAAQAVVPAAKPAAVKSVAPAAKPVAPATKPAVKAAPAKVPPRVKA